MLGVFTHLSDFSSCEITVRSQRILDKQTIVPLVYFTVRNTHRCQYFLTPEESRGEGRVELRDKQRRVTLRLIKQ